MSVLFVGAGSRQPSCFEGLWKDMGREVICCTNQQEALKRYRQNEGEFDWIILDGTNSDSAIGAARQFRSMGSRASIALLTMDEEFDRNASESPSLVGVFERRSEGSRLLNCVLSEPSYKKAKRESEPVGPLEILFEYHAPCRG